MVRRGGKREATEIELGAVLQHRLALGEILAARADVTPCRDRKFGNEAAVFASFRILLDQHGIGTLGHRCAGENPDSLARPHSSAKGMTGGRGSDNGQHGAWLGRVGAAQGIAVHGGGIEWRLCHPRQQVARKRPATGL